MPKFTDRLQHAWNAFLNRDPTEDYTYTNHVNPEPVVTYSYNPYKPRLTRGNDKSIVNAMYNRIATDIAQINIRHALVNEDGHYLETVDDGLNQCLSVNANKDQSARDFIKDIVLSMFDEGYVAVVPIDTDRHPALGAFQIESMRTAKILEWRPDEIKVRCYNDRTGKYEERWAQKSFVAIMENPFYSIMNEANSVPQRLIRKLNMLDAIDEQSSSGKFNMVIQLPYAVKTSTKKQQAEDRRKDIEMQLTGSKYGIAYIDATEKITQLNRPLENNLMEQINYLTETLYSQLGMTKEILDGKANEQTMLNYTTQTLEPILNVIVDAMTWKFLSKTARTKNHRIVFFKDPFKLVPTSRLAELGDKFTRNAIMSSNEMRQVIGLRPVNDPRADELRNKNLNEADNGQGPIVGENYQDTGGYEDYDDYGDYYDPAVDENIEEEEIQNG